MEFEIAIRWRILLGSREGAVGYTSAGGNIRYEYEQSVTEKWDLWAGAAVREREQQ